MPNESTIKFHASVARIQTMADGGLRFTFDVGEMETLAAVQLMECKRLGAVLEIEATALINNKDQSNAIQEGTERKSVWSPAKE